MGDYTAQGQFFDEGKKEVDPILPTNPVTIRSFLVVVIKRGEKCLISSFLPRPKCNP